MPFQPGSANFQSKLTPAQVAWVHEQAALRKRGKEALSRAEVARHLKVDVRRIYDIEHGLAYAGSKRRAK